MNQAQNRKVTHSGLINTLKQNFLIWLAQHLQALLFSLRYYIRFLANNLLTTTVIGIVTLFPAGFYMIVENVQRAPMHWHDTVQFTAFLKLDVQLEEAQSLADTLHQDADIAAVRLIDKDQALVEYQRLSGFSDVISSLDENPLPHALLIKPNLSQQDSGQQQLLIDKLSRFEQIEHIQYNLQWVARLFLLLDIIKRVVLLLSILLLVTALLIIGNTIRLSIYNRRQEIEIAKLFGATNAFIRRPFLYCGLWHGSLGMLITWLLLMLSLQFLAPPIDKLVDLYSGQFELISPSFHHFLILLGIGAGLGLAGAWISVWRYINT